MSGNEANAKGEPMPKRFYVNATINTPRGEHDQRFETDSLDEVMSRIVADQPSCTSVVISVVPNNDEGRWETEDEKA